MSTRSEIAPKNILVFRIGNLGDTLVALPAFWTVRNTFPDAHITLLSNVASGSAAYPTPRGVIPNQGIFDSYLSYPTQAGKVTRAVGLAKLFFQIRAGKYDMVVYLMPRIRSPRQIERDLKFFKMAGIARSIGANYLLENNLMRPGLDPNKRIEREGEYLLKCLTEEGMAANFKGDGNDILLSAEENAKAEHWLIENVGADYADKRLVAVAPGSKWETKVWPEEKFTEALSRLITNQNCFPIIFGGPEDFDKGERILKALGVGTNAAGTLGIREAAAALGKCALYFGNDTGPMHLAAAMGVSCVAIFSAIGFKGCWEPFGDNNAVLRIDVDCAGCNSGICKFNNECMETTVDQAYEACLRVLEKSGGN